ncbi:MAG: hypothetical protein WB676_10055 [Bryobacteraceae bacterium]
MWLPILAQFQIPVNPGTVDLMSYVTKALDGIVDPSSEIFLATAQPILNKLGLLALVLGALSWTYSYLTGNHIFSSEHFWRVLVRYLIAYNMLRYYNQPLPLVGYSFHQLFTEEARWMAAQIDIRILDRFWPRFRTSGPRWKSRTSGIFRHPHLRGNRHGYGFHRVRAVRHYRI